ncbi:unnamed protein product [Linum trigynum]|uniref:Uncharacterized protein n=1 Tax=Linum trigynum TaxID=586398 RepID=A0AAV2CVQ3_9ROSI
MMVPKEEGSLGFRDLEGFNTPMLAKQLWLLHQRSNSLVGRNVFEIRLPTCSCWISTKFCLEAWCIVLWFLWKERNCHLFNVQKLAEQDIIPRAEHFLADYKTVRVAVEMSLSHDGSWRPPPPGHVKINGSSKESSGEYVS